MYRTTRGWEKWIAVALALAVSSVGLALSYAAYKQRSTEHRQKVAGDFDGTARQFAFLVQRRLDAYAATSQSVAGYVATSHDIDNKNFVAFIKAARYFEQQAGLSSLGYLPRVAPKDAAAFERQAAREFPGFKIRGRRAEADFYYPMLYGVHARGEARTNSVRGIDFSALPERLAAIRSADARDALVFTPPLPALKDGTPMLFTFIPARTLRESGDKEGGKGMVYAALNVRTFFDSIDNGRTASLFDVEIYQVVNGRKRVIYDGDGQLHAASASSAPYAYAQELRYTDQVWQLYFLARPNYIAAHADHHSVNVLAIGALLSLVAAYLTFMLAGRYVRRQATSAVAGRMESFFESHPFAVCVLDREGRFVFVNKKMAQELGVERERLIGMSKDQFISAGNKDMAAAHFKAALTGQAAAYHNRIVSTTGEISDAAIVLIPITVRGEVTRVLAFAENITERKRFERELYESRQKLQLILDTVPLGVFWKDLDCAYVGANRQMLEEAGLESVEQIVGRTDYELAWREFAEQYRREDRQVMESGVAQFHIHEPYRIADGTTRWVETSKVPLKDDSGTVTGLLGVLRDITENKRMEEELLRRANHDALTGLPNRSFFHAELHQAIRRAPRRGQLALMFFDIDRFKQINDSFGHDAGDEVIRTFGSRMRAAVRESDFLARLGGDEFVLIVEDLSRRGDAAGVAEKLVAAMQPPMEIGEHVHAVSTSIGVAFLEEGMSAGQLVKAADDAMYEAKRAGRNCYRGVLPTQE